MHMSVLDTVLVLYQEDMYSLVLVLGMVAVLATNLEGMV